MLITKINCFCQHLAHAQCICQQIVIFCFFLPNFLFCLYRVLVLCHDTRNSFFIIQEQNAAKFVFSSINHHYFVFFLGMKWLLSSTKLQVHFLLYFWIIFKSSLRIIFFSSRIASPFTNITTFFFTGFLLFFFISVHVVAVVLCITKMHH